MKVLIIGRTEILYNTALMLAKEHTICGIITSTASPEYNKKEDDFEKLALELNCPFINCKVLNKNAIEFINTCQPEIAVSVNWVSVINSNIIDFFPYGILNCHPGDLPRYRGNAVCNWAMINKEKEIIVTIHYMVAGELDSGDILVQDKFPIRENTTITEFVKYWEEITPSLFEKAIDGLVNKSIMPIKQSLIKKDPFRCFPRLPIDSKIDWTKKADEIDLIIRASAKPYSGAYTYYKINDEIKKVFIWKSRVFETETRDIGTPGQIIFNNKVNGESHVLTGGGILAICEVQYENEEVFCPGIVWKSIRTRFGIDIEQELILLKKYIDVKLGRI